MTDLPPSRGGAAGMLFLFALVATGAGLAFDFFLNQERGFWIGAQPGGRAVIGAAAGVLVIVAGHVLRLLFGRAKTDNAGAGDANDHA